MNDVRSTAQVLVNQTQTVVATTTVVSATPPPTLGNPALTRTLQAAIDERSTAAVRDQAVNDVRSTAQVLVYQTQTVVATMTVVSATPPPTVSNPALTQTFQAALDERSTAFAQNKALNDLRSTAMVLVNQTQTAVVLTISPTPTTSPTPTPTARGPELTQTLQAVINERSTALVDAQATNDLRGTALVFAFQTATIVARTHTDTYINAHADTHADAYTHTNAHADTSSRGLRGGPARVRHILADRHQVKDG